MKDKYEYLRQIIKKNNISGSTTDEFMWSLWYVNCFYYEGNINPRDIKNHWTDGTGDGGIDYVYYDEDLEDVFLIQGKSESNLNIDKIKAVFQKMADTIEVFEQGREVKAGLNPKIIKAYKKGISDKKKENIKLVLITGTSINENLQQQIDFWKENLFNDYEIIIYDKEEIEEQEASVSSGERVVKKGSLECADNGILKYSNGKNDGIIINVKAKSLKELFQKDGDNGLFGYNLREYITKNKLEVDNAIKDTIKNEKENFWFYNNGITIACKKYSLKDNIINLYDFSIINGAQTTTLIGKSLDIDNDTEFSIVCKVVSSQNSLNDDFIKNISKASNSQKEIESRDLYANTVEQIQLQHKFRTNQYPLAVTIKRGVKPSNYKNVESWQRIDNLKLGQIILSAYLQKPGTARNTPKCIFAVQDVYNKIFNIKTVSNYNYNALYDLVRMQYYFENYKKFEISKRSSKKKITGSFTKNIDKIIKQQNELGVLKNCGYTVISIITYLIKRMYFDIPKINNARDEYWNKFINKSIDTDLSLHCDQKEYDKNIDLLFSIVMEILYEIYDKEFKDPNSSVNNPSNFFKSDEIYRKRILPIFDELLEKQPDNILFKKMEMFNCN